MRRGAALCGDGVSGVMRMPRDRTNDRETYFWRKEHHICLRCGRKDAEPHKRMCAECAAKVAAYSLKQYHAMDAAAKKRRQEQKKRLVASRIMRGLCRECGRKAVKGRTRCLDCIVKDNRRARKRAEARRVKTDFSEGLCSYCNEPIVPGKKLCAKHLAIAQRCIEIARRARSMDKHTWREDNKWIFRKKK